MTLQERVDKIEAENRELRLELASQRRRSRLGSLAVAAVLAVGLLSAARTGDPAAVSASQVTAKKFILTDERGNSTWVLTSNATGPSMEFGDGKGNVAMRIASHNDGGAGIELLDAKGKDAAGLAHSATGVSQFLLQVDGHVLYYTVSADGVASEKR